MNGKHLPPLRIEPQEAIALFTHAKVEEMYRVKDLYTAYREARGTDTDSLWDIMSLLSFVYDTARIHQNTRDKRGKSKTHITRHKGSSSYHSRGFFLIT